MYAPLSSRGSIAACALPRVQSLADSSMSAAALSPAAVLAFARLREIRDELEIKLFYGKTRQEYEWHRLPVADKKLLLMLAGVGSIDALESMAGKSYKELTPPERDAIATAQRSLRRLVRDTQALGSMSAGIP